MESVKKIFFGEKEIRVMEKEDGLWFVGRDVGTALDYATPEGCIKRHVSQENKTKDVIQIKGRNRSVVIINEAGLKEAAEGCGKEIGKALLVWCGNELKPEKHVLSDLAEESFGGLVEDDVPAEETPSVKDWEKVMEPEKENPLTALGQVVRDACAKAAETVKNIFDSAKEKPEETTAEKVEIFSNPAFGTVRTIEKDGEVWFVGKDVADILGYSDTFGALKKHVDDEDKLNCQSNSFESNRGMTVINESGLYSLILSSKLPTARAFKRWVTSEVLPSIRKHGAYATEVTIDKILENPDFGIKLLADLKQERAKAKMLEFENAIMRPKAEYVDDLVDRKTLTSFRDTAKEFDVREKTFIKALMDMGYIYRDQKGKLMPYADKNNGLFEVKDCKGSKNGWSGCQTLITVKGKELFRLTVIPKLRGEEDESKESV